MDIASQKPQSIDAGRPRVRVVLGMGPLNAGTPSARGFHDKKYFEGDSYFVLPSTSRTRERVNFAHVMALQRWPRPRQGKTKFVRRIICIPSLVSINKKM